jgi:hypothetical protein
MQDSISGEWNRFIGELNRSLKELGAGAITPDELEILMKDAMGSPTRNTLRHVAKTMRQPKNKLQRELIVLRQEKANLQQIHQQKAHAKERQLKWVVDKLG